MMDKELIQDVIDRILKYGASYEKKLKELNNEFPLNYNQSDPVRKYERTEKFKDRTTLEYADKK